MRPGTSISTVGWADGHFGAVYATVNQPSAGALQRGNFGAVYATVNQPVC